MFQFVQNATSLALGNVVVYMADTDTRTDAEIAAGYVAGSAYTMKPYERVLIRPVCGTDVTVTLPRPELCMNQCISIHTGDSSSNELTVVDPSGSMANSVLDASTYSRRLFYSDGIGWFAIATA